jgi:hypothetical protein
VETIPGRLGCANHRMVWLRRAEDHVRHSRCERPAWAGCEECGRRELWRCGSSSEDACHHCAQRYRRRVGRVVCSGRYSAGTILLLTLTAPGDQVHHLPNGERCDCTPPGGIDLAEWNAGLGHRWNRFCQDLRRDLGQQVQYFKATEVQDRGALHLHVPLRLVVGTKVNLAAIRRLAISHGFGHSVDLRVVKNEAGLRYVAKYVSKASAFRPIVPWRRIDQATGEVRTWATYRTWTASRCWGKTMGQVKAEQIEFVRAGGADSAAAGSTPAAGTAALDSNAHRYTTAPPNPPRVEGQ